MQKMLGGRKAMRKRKARVDGDMELFPVHSQQKRWSSATLFLNFFLLQLCRQKLKPGDFKLKQGKHHFQMFPFMGP